MKILIFTTDLPPLKGYPTSGTALRTYNLALGLRELGNEVIISPPKSALSSFLNSNSENTSDNLEIEEYKKFSFDSNNQASVIAEVRPDFIICGHWPAWTLGRKPDVPLVIDIAGPHLLEKYYQGDSDQTAAVMGKLRSLSCADFFIVSGPKQRLYFMSFILRAKIPEPDKRIITIPMPLGEVSSAENKEINTNYPSFIFGGIFLPWQNPSWALGKLSEELLNKETGSLTLVGGPHPHYEIKSGTYEKLFKNLESNSKVKRLPLLPYEDFLSMLPNSDVAIDVMEWNLERELAITIRTTSYLWSGVPVIYNDYSDLSDLIKKYDAGWCISPGDESGFDKILEEIYANPSLVKQKGLNAKKLAAENFDRKTHAKNLIELINSPRVISKEVIDIAIETAENCDYQFDKYNGLTQSFFSRVNGLSRVELLFGLHGETSTDSLKITLTDKITKSIVTDTEFSPSEINNNEWITLNFSPIADSAGRSYDLKIESLNKNTTSKLSPWVSGASPYPLNGLFINKKRLGSNSLCIKTYSQRLGF